MDGREWLRVLRDVAIVYGLTFLGGLIIGTTNLQGARAVVPWSNLILGVGGFAIAGCLHPVRRWWHLLLVAIGIWLVSLSNVVLYNFSFATWLFSAIITAVVASAGGGLSLIIVKSRP